MGDIEIITLRENPNIVKLSIILKFLKRVIFLYTMKIEIYGTYYFLCDFSGNPVNKHKKNIIKIMIYSF